jgi:hypothetical protein
MSSSQVSEKPQCKTISNIFYLIQNAVEDSSKYFIVISDVARSIYKETSMLLEIDVKYEIIAKRIAEGYIYGKFIELTDDDYDYNKTVSRDTDNVFGVCECYNSFSNDKTLSYDDKDFIRRRGGVFCTILNNMDGSNILITYLDIFFALDNSFYNYAS